MTLDIPDEAQKAAWDEFWYQSTAGAPAEAAVEAAVAVAVPLALAAELERLADSIESNARLFVHTPTGDVRRDSHWAIAEGLRARAREPRGGTHG